MFGPAWNVVSLARLVGRRLAVYGQVEQAAHDYAPLGAVGVGRDLEPLCGPEEDRLAVGARDHTPLQALEGRVYLREVLDPTRIRVHSGSFPCERRVCAAGQGVIILTVPKVSGGEMERLRGKRAIVTGAGSGIGRAIALRFVEEGARVVISDVDGEAATSVVSEAGGETLVRKTDVTDSSEVEALVETSVEEWGGLDVMVNNAGIGVAGTTTDTQEGDYERVMDVCLRGTFLGMKHAIPAIRDSGGGSVINLSSVAALVGIADRAVYSAAKGAILAITRAAAIDHVEEGVRVNCIAPGTVDTPWIGRITAGYDDPEEARRNMQARQPHGRLVTPEEIAAMAAYLASDESASVIGACMIVDGGITAR
jgi:meso-butanediol dehydrogenase / (S,S)-butanediol dehydrogenase / diacetyl reductase